MTNTPADDPAERLRAFNRFYTQRIGVLHERLVDSPCSLTESRLLWELAHAASTASNALTATTLARRLGLDLGYVSRLVSGLRRRGWVHGVRAAHDGRQVSLRLTTDGERAFAPIDERAHDEAAALMQTLSAAGQDRLLTALDTVRGLLDSTDASTGPAASPVVLRAHRPGDIGWVIARHAELYADEYGWDIGFESMVARIAADFIDRFDADREACWIAECSNGSGPAQRLGCVFVVQARSGHDAAPRAGVAQLRMLIVEPAARGLGLGRRLVGTCTDFARTAGYQRIVLWTNSVLGAARHLYQQAGYQLQTTGPHRQFGKELVGETWELIL